MNRQKTIVTIMAVATMSMTSTIVTADVFSEAAKIGANAGAMKYCRDRIALKDEKSKYNLLAIKTAGIYDDLSSDDKLKALVYRKAAEDGDYLGDPLTKSRCDSLRKLLFLKD